MELKTNTQTIPVRASYLMAKDLKSYEKILLIFLSEIINKDPSNGTQIKNKVLAEWLGIKNNRVSQIISSLERKGYIRVEIDLNNAPLSRTIYLSE